MLKRIETNQLRVGMFIESLEGCWLDTPFAGRRFLLDSEADALALKRSNASGIFINTAKGLDAAQTTESGHRAVSAAGAKAKRLTQPGGRLAKERAAAAKTVADTTQLLKGIFDAARAGRGVTVDMVAPIISQITTSVERNGDVLISITRLKSKDETTFLHSIAVSALMIRFARHLKLDEPTVRILGMGGLLHDIGKLAIPTELLTREGTLTAEEMTLMRAHPVQGHALLAHNSGMPDIVLDVCLHHHERLDGKGYPFGLAGDAISLHARMGAICDVYDAITSARPYKRPWPLQEAASWMLERKGVFDRQLLQQFLNGVLKS